MPRLHQIIGVRIPPSPPPIFGSEKVLQNQAFPEPPDFGGGAPRWSTAASPSCHSLNHFGASHSAPLSSLAPACASMMGMTPAKYAATIANLRNQDIRGGPPHDQTRLPDDSGAFHDKLSGERRQHHQQRCPQERRIEIGKRQALGVHAENASNQCRRHQYRRSAIAPAAGVSA